MDDKVSERGVSAARVIIELEYALHCAVRIQDRVLDKNEHGVKLQSGMLRDHVARAFKELELVEVPS